MNYTATKLRLLDNLVIELTFLDGNIIQYDLTKLFSKYPQFKALQDNQKLYRNGELWPLGEVVYWNEDIDLDTILVYKEGTIVGHIEPSINQKIALLITKAREENKITQTQLSKLSSIDQGDISRIERGIGNPTLKKIEKLFSALNKTLDINIKWKRRKMS